jgi:YD repeat-containing protein
LKPAWRISSGKGAALNRLVRTADQAGGITLREYGGDGRMIKPTSPEGAETSYECDLAGRAVKITDALGGETAYMHDPMGRVVESADANGALRQKPGQGQLRPRGRQGKEYHVHRHEGKLSGAKWLLP